MEYTYPCIINVTQFCPALSFFVICHVTSCLKLQKVQAFKHPVIGDHRRGDGGNRLVSHLLRFRQLATEGWLWQSADMWSCWSISLRGRLSAIFHLKLCKHILAQSLVLHCKMMIVACFLQIWILNRRRSTRNCVNPALRFGLAAGALYHAT